MSPLRIAFCCPYQLELLQPEIVLSREMASYPSSWIANLAGALGAMDDVRLHVLTVSANVPYDQRILKGKIAFHVLKTGVPEALGKFWKVPKHSPFIKPVWKMAFTLKSMVMLTGCIG